MGTFAKDAFAIVLLPPGMKGADNGISSKALWLKATTYVLPFTKFSLPKIFTGQPISLNQVHIHTLETAIKKF